MLTLSLWILRIVLGFIGAAVSVIIGTASGILARNEDVRYFIFLGFAIGIILNRVFIEPIIIKKFKKDQ